MVTVLTALGVTAATFLVKFFVLLLAERRLATYGDFTVSVAAAFSPERSRATARWYRMLPSSGAALTAFRRTSTARRS